MLKLHDIIRTASQLCLITFVKTVKVSGILIKGQRICSFLLLSWVEEISMEEFLIRLFVVCIHRLLVLSALMMSVSSSFIGLPTRHLLSHMAFLIADLPRIRFVKFLLKFPEISPANYC
ncbi:hypothetical protein CEXT_770261 [Caerostris extrusa]|uniref:Uncharacterized protein n=1 Tax=Caerostris extrusa TaxID=172846 RepID=A0AAV4PB25_CAEEX|nr:hypothetical protein CEXT_770261 [Caerostris extrusa]